MTKLINMSNNKIINKILVFENKTFDQLTDPDEIQFMQNIKDRLVDIIDDIEKEPEGIIQGFNNGIVMTTRFSRDLEYEIRQRLNI